MILAIASILLALFTAEFICLSKDSSWSIYMPRSFSQADLFSWCPSIKYSLSPTLDFFPIDIDTHFSGWNFSNHTDDQLYMFCKSVCNWVWSVKDSILLNTLVLSAKRNMNVSGSTTSGRSFIYTCITKRSGPSTMFSWVYLIVWLFTWFRTLLYWHLRSPYSFLFTDPRLLAITFLQSLCFRLIFSNVFLSIGYISFFFLFLICFVGM